MAEKDENSQIKDFKIETHIAQGSFIVKGSSNLDWGMKDRLTRIFNSL